jgi:ABC-type ATPase with predicted acetyltransferase domain
LNDVPTWCRPYTVLSNGQQFRADLARQIGDRAIIDEFTSVVSRPVAMSTCHGLRRWVDHHDVRCMVVASCHHDIEEWLRPDWVIDTDHGVFREGPAGRRTWHAYPVAELRLELE